ncbi:MAG: WG repeat-containing protein [Defluviitaleaceae bacterium]|nr:WG repeat-containing protein [Defluviitaleaceae bacterium]
MKRMQKHNNSRNARKARQGKARQGKARQGKARQGKAILLAFVLMLAMLAPVYAQGGNPDFDWVIEPQFVNARPFSEGLAMASLDDLRWGYIDTSGNFAIAPQFYGFGIEFAPDSFSHGYAIVIVDPNEWVIAMIDRSGNIVAGGRDAVAGLSVMFGSFGNSRFSEDGLAMMVRGDDIFGDLVFVDTNLNIVMDVPVWDWNWDRRSTFSGGLAAVPVQIGGEPHEGGRIKWGFIDMSGEFVIPPQFFSASAFSEGLAVVTVDDGGSPGGFGLPGFIDISGNMVIEPQFAGAMSFSEGLSAVRVDTDGELSRWGFIDRVGNMVIEPQFERFERVVPSRFSNGIAVVTVSPRLYNHKDAYGNIIRENLSWAPPLASLSPGHQLVRIADYESVLIDTTGRIVSDTIYGRVIGLSEGLVGIETPAGVGFVAVETLLTQHPSAPTHPVPPFITAPNSANEANVTINGVLQSFDVPAQLIHGRTMLPLRAIGEALGLDVGFDGATNIATLTAPGVNISHTIYTAEITVNGTVQIFDVSSVTVDGRTLVPVRMLAEAIGAEMEWDAATRTAAITTN